MITIAICDDDIVFAQSIHKIIEKYTNKCKIHIFDKSTNLLKILDDDKKFNIYILDIEMPDVDGMKLATQIRDEDENAVIIFLTNYDKYVFDAYEINAFRYIQKAKILEKLPEAIRKSVKLIEKINDYVVINDSNIIEKVKLNSIIYIDKSKKYVEYHLDDDRIIKERTTLNNALERINDPRFITIKKGVIINLERVKHFSETKVIMENEVECYISRSYYKSVTNKIMKYLGE